jgi:hypothetical protein
MILLLIKHSQETIYKIYSKFAFAGLEALARNAI